MLSGPRFRGLVFKQRFATRFAFSNKCLRFRAEGAGFTV